jgi:hypothetical protein
MFGLVSATLDGLRELVRQNAGLRHVCLLSGSCLPLRPIDELDGFLAKHPTTDFIESVPGREAAWVQGGLSKERFTLWFPFAWKRQRTAFDFLVDLQRACKVRRRIPAGINPHLGLQWWCLSVATIIALLDHPRLPEFVRYFRHTWIPDESFFQSLVRLVSPSTIRSQPLTLQRFDGDGRPLVFHDDHASFLESTDHFFARKIDPDADNLYRRYMSESRTGLRHDFVGMVDRQAFETETVQTRGLVAPGRFPDHTSWSRSETARPYLVVYAESENVLRITADKLADASPDLTVHGRLFRAEALAEFAEPGELGVGNLPGAPLLRNYRPAQFLSRIVWLEQPRRVCFLMMPEDEEYIRVQLMTDPNARLVILGDEETAKAAVDRLSRPVPFIGKRLIKKPKRLRRASWYRALELRADGSSLRTISNSDWSDPTGWVTP